MTAITFPMIVLYLTNSPIAAGWVAFAATAPSILVYIPAGALVDLLDPKRTMLLSEFGRGAAISGVVAMVALGWRNVLLYVLAAVLEETLEVFSTLAERRYVGSLVEPTQASPALVRVEARTHIVVLIGRPLGGLLFELQPLAPFIFDVLTFAGSISALLGIKRGQSARNNFTSSTKEIGTRDRLRRAVTRSDQLSDWHIGNDMGEGLRWLWGNQFARASLALLASTTLISQALIMVFIVQAHTQHISSITVGVVLAMSGLGGALGSAVASPFRALLAHSFVLIQMLVWSIAFAILAMTGGQSPMYMGMVMAVLGFMGAMSNIEVDTYLIQTVPEAMLARITSIGRLISFAACASGPVIGGFLFKVYGAQDGVQNSVRWLLVTTVLLAAYSILIPSMRARRNDNAAEARRQAAQEASARVMALRDQLATSAACAKVKSTAVAIVDTVGCLTAMAVRVATPVALGVYARLGCCDLAVP